MAFLINLVQLLSKMGIGPKGDCLRPYQVSAVALPKQKVHPATTSLTAGILQRTNILPTYYGHALVNMSTSNNSSSNAPLPALPPRPRLGFENIGPPPNYQLPHLGTVAPLHPWLDLPIAIPHLSPNHSQLTAPGIPFLLTRVLLTVSPVLREALPITRAPLTKRALPIKQALLTKRAIPIRRFFHHGSS